MEQASNERLVSLDDEPPLLKTTSLQTSHNSESYQFRKKYFKNTKLNQWNDWHWQLFHRITTKEQLLRFLEPTTDELEALNNFACQLPFSITPYYMSLINRNDINDPLRKTVIPQKSEKLISAGEAVDPLGEVSSSPVKSLVHRYPDRALFLVTNFCSVYCRYCTRSRIVGHHDDTNHICWNEAFEYLEKHKEIRDVIISGGDPLTLSDERLKELLSRFAALKHIEIVRIGTKVPFVLPQRINSKLIKVLKSFRPLYINIHATHPNEFTESSIAAINKLADAGFVLGSQTVLLKDVNDSVKTMTALMHNLLKVRVRPYYLFQCDPIVGSAHFRTTVAKGKEIMEGLYGHTSGLAIPRYVIDTPGGGGKVPLYPEYELSHDNEGYKLRNYEGRTFTYPEFDGQKTL